MNRAQIVIVFLAGVAIGALTFAIFNQLHFAGRYSMYIPPNSTLAVYRLDTMTGRIEFFVGDRDSEKLRTRTMTEGAQRW